MAIPLPPALAAERRDIDSPAGRLSYYADLAGGAAQPPLLLLHSVNAAASAYEIKPLFERYRGSRPVFAPDLPGFGFSERSDRPYSPRLMTDAVRAMLAEIAARTGARRIDALALSLSCEFLARAAVEAPGALRSLALVSPTGLDRRGPRLGAAGATLGRAWLHAMFARMPWRQAFFDLLTSRRSIRYFLRKTWGGPDIDAGMVDYDYASARQPGARHAPYRFVSGYLFSADIGHVYRAVSVPVWASHGTRGDFADYRQLPDLARDRFWRVSVYRAGALPHFERPDEFAADYDAFLAALPEAAA